MPEQPRIVFDPHDPEVNAYKLVSALVVPRPIAWISTMSADGVGNLAPHSFYTVASARPPIVQFTSVGVKDTLRNIRETGEFTINVASLPQIQQVNATSVPLPWGEDEAMALDIAMEPSQRVRPQRVADAPASIECTLHSTVDLGESIVVLGDVVAVTVRASLVADGHPDFTGLAPVSRLGRDEWGLPPGVVRLDRPTRPGA